VILQTFAYPFGQKHDYTEHTEELIKNAGYAYAFTTEGVFSNLKNPYTISRLCIEDALPQKSLKQWIEGGYDMYHKLKSVCVR